MTAAERLDLYSSYPSTMGPYIHWLGFMTAAWDPKQSLLQSTWRIIMKKKSGKRNLGDIWKTSGRTSGRHPGDIWEISGRHLGDIWETSRRHQGDIWKIFEKHLGDIWQTFGETQLPEVAKRRKTMEEQYFIVEIKVVRKSLFKYQLYPVFWR